MSWAPLACATGRTMTPCLPLAPYCSIYNLPTELSHHYNEVLFSAEMGRKGQAGSGEAGASGGVV